MANNSSRDIHLTLDGDIEVGYDGDIKISIDDDVLVDHIIFRLKTYQGDFELEPQCGASLEDLVGEPNTRAVGELAESKVIWALTHDRFIDPANLSVRAVPLNAETLLIALQVTGQRATFDVLAALDLKTGLLEVRT